MAFAFPTAPTDGQTINIGDDIFRYDATKGVWDKYEGDAILAGFRNILINGAVTINQRGTTYAAAAVGDYWADRWKKTAGGMTQIVEDGNYQPSTEYTLSGTGVTTQQITSPASGNWTIPDVPSTATNIQLEPGPVATPFEHRPIGTELALCQRYLEASGTPGTTHAARWIAISDGNGVAPTSRCGTIMFFQTPKRVKPTMTYFSYNGASGAVSTTTGTSAVHINGTTLAASATTYGTQLRRPGVTVIDTISQYWGDFYADAEL